MYDACDVHNQPGSFGSRRWEQIDPGTRADASVAVVTAGESSVMRVQAAGEMVREVGGQLVGRRDPCSARIIGMRAGAGTQGVSRAFLLASRITGPPSAINCLHEERSRSTRAGWGDGSDCAMEMTRPGVSACTVTEPLLSITATSAQSTGWNLSVGLRKR